MAIRYRAAILALVLLGAACGGAAPTETGAAREAAEITAPPTTASSTPAPSTTAPPPTTTSLDFLAELAAKETVEVLVAVRDIPAGTNGADVVRSLEVAAIPMELRPASALRPGDIEALVGLVTTSPVAKNQVIIPTFFTAAPVETTPPNLPEGTVAVSFPHDSISPAAPLLAVGAVVDFVEVADDGTFGAVLGSGEVIHVADEYYGIAIPQETATQLVTAQAANVVVRRSAG